MARRTLGLLVAFAAAALPAAAQHLRLVQVAISDRAGLDSLARLGFEVADVRRAGGGLYAVIVVDDAGATRLRDRGLAPLAVPGAPAAATSDSFKVYRSFDKPVTGIRATLAAWAAADTLIHVDSIGASIEGRPILAVKIGAATDAPSRPNILFMATHHAREWMSTEMAMRLIRWIADSLPRPLLAARDLWVIPVENPDGYQYTFTTERLWRKNRRVNGDGSTGVDPNRNYPAFWGYDNLGSSPTGNTEIYRGAGPASEPETQAIVAFHAAHPPVLAVSYHTYSGLVLYPYGFRTGALAPDAPVFQALAGTDILPGVIDSLPNSVLTHYHPGPSWNLYPTNGEYTEWAYRAHGTIAFTPELTGGCCTPDSSLYYGFVFPDDSALVERVFRDNLPFARAVIAAADAVAAAIGPSGLVPSSPRFEALWPETWLSWPAAATAPYSLTVRTGTGAIVSRSLSADSLARGRWRITWKSDLSSGAVRAVRADGPGFAAELIALSGAENADAGWIGWPRSSDALAGSWSWATPGNDTLLSPVVDLSGRSRVWLQFWTKHAGSTFTPENHGVVQFSADSGATWTDVALVEGDGGSWYPMRVDLPQAAGVRGARLRFAANGFPWWLDAVGLVTDSTVLFQAVAAAGTAEVSENPVKSDLVVITWPAGTGSARVGIYTFAGTPLVRASVAAGLSEYDWDLTVGGRHVSNGAYLIVVQVDGKTYRRRLFVTRPGP